MRIVIGEDEILIAEHLADIVKSFNHQVVGIGHYKAEIIELITKLKPDLILLDIRMEHEYDGIEIGKYVQYNLAIPFIYITAHSDKAIIEKALPTKPSGYIIKPFKPMDVYTAIHIASDKFRNPKTDNFLMLKDGIKQVKVFYYNIIFMKADNNYVEIHTSNKIYIDRNSLENLNEKMQSEDFIRIHRSFIINKTHIKSLTINEIEIGNQKLPISRNYLPLLKQFFIDTHKS